jgi:hypothetical protein
MSPPGEALRGFRNDPPIVFTAAVFRRPTTPHLQPLFLEHTFYSSSYTLKKGVTWDKEMLHLVLVCYIKPRTQAQTGRTHVTVGSVRPHRRAVLSLI